MVLDSVRPTTSGGRFPLVMSFMIDDARVVQGERRAELARAMLSRSPHSQSISLMLCKGTTFFLRFQIFALDLGRFSARIDEISHRGCSRSAELMQAWLCSRLIASLKRFLRAVFPMPRSRNFRALKITSRRQRAGSY